MKRVIAFVILSLISIYGQSPLIKISENLISQFHTELPDKKFHIWIYFTDKGNQTESFFSNPLSLISEKSLKRRQRTKSNIDYTDLPVNPSYVEQIKSFNIQIKHKSKWFNAVSGFADKHTIIEISKFGFVKQIDIVKGFAKSKPYPIFEEQEVSQINKIQQFEKSNLLDYGISFTQVNLINVPAVHNLGYNGNGVTICVMDAGFNNLAHVAFNNINIIAAWDFVNGDPNVGDENDMGSGSHGTYVLSVLGGFAQGNLIGPAYAASFILAKTENTDSETPVEEDNWIAALEWADSIGVDITSTSLGYLEYDFPFNGYTWQNMDGNTALITRAADLAVKKGIVVVNSAGNEGNRGTPNTLMAPADGDSVLAIGAVDGNGLRVSFSSYGPTVDGRIKPDFMAMGSGVVSAKAFNQTQFTFVSGTSFSCPLTSGAIALLLQANPNLTPIQLRNILRQTSSRSNNPDNYHGWGIINTLAALNQILNVKSEISLSGYELYQNYPNPFNPSTVISWKMSESGWVSIKIYNSLGQEAGKIVDAFYESGTHSYNFSAGPELSSGVYLYRIESGNFKDSKKMMLLR